VRKVTGGTLRCNAAMVRIMQACGMQPDGVRAGQELVDGEPQDVLYFARFAG
jgi:RimJ/RimL family protein N-acetyltransferase